MSDMFLTDGGASVPSVTVDQMREIDRVAIEGQTPNLCQMMENAGRGLAGLVTTRLGRGWADTPISVLAGPGGNGGGGTAAARHLANRGGDITLIMSRQPQPDTILQQQLDIYMETGGRVSESLTGEPGLIIDALLGYGLDDAPHGAIGEMITATNEADVHVVSLDVPSGVDGDTGQTPGRAVVADETLTLALPKAGLGAAQSGDIWLADLGIPLGVFKRVGVEIPPRIFGDGALVHLNRKLS
ncbi:MAG: NAD(P)H-hydrate epimerase [Actinomycetota bacterium]